MSETPRTDAVIMKCYKDDGDFEYVESDFTRQLERELTAAQAEIAELKRRNEELRLIGFMSPSNICRTYHAQNCHVCDDLSCCDNQSKAKMEIDELKTKLAESEKGKVNLGKLANATRRRLSVLNCHPYTINEIDSLICNWMEGGGE